MWQVQSIVRQRLGCPFFVCLAITLTSCGSLGVIRNHAFLQGTQRLPDGRTCTLAVLFGEPAYKGANSKFGYGGDRDDYRPATAITTLEMTVDGRRVSIPPASFNDLGDPSVVLPKVALEGQDIVVTIEGGGDGWASYRAKLLVESDAVVERRVANMMAGMVGKGGYKPDIKVFAADRGVLVRNVR